MMYTVALAVWTLPHTTCAYLRTGLAPGHFLRSYAGASRTRPCRYLTRLHDRLLRTGLAELTDPSPPASTALRTADRAYQAAIDDLARQAGLTA